MTSAGPIPSWQKFAFPMLSGLLLTASFPPPGLSFLAWIALVPLLVSLRDQTPSQGFLIGLGAGLVHNITLLYWVVLVLEHYGDLNPIASLGPFLLLCLYLSLFPALFSCLSPYFRNTTLPSLWMAGLWVGLEFIRARFLTGFPWCLLGYSQYPHLHLIQMADLFGVYGLSFLIVFINAVVFTFFSESRRRRYPGLKFEVMLAILCVGGAFAYGHHRLSQTDSLKESHGLRVALIQGNIDQSLKWEPAYQTETIRSYQRLSRLAYGFKPDLLVWPETSVPFFFQEGKDLSHQVRSVARESGASLLFGSPAFKPSSDRPRYFNRAYLITPAGGADRFYDKVHLVPFGEYIPLRSVFFFLQRLLHAVGDFESGERVAPIKINGASLGVLICFEAIFPEIARRQAQQGASLLVNLTNDAWFGRTSAPYHHLAMAVFRAVENRIPLVRAANTGFSAIIGPEGKIREAGPLFAEEVLAAVIPVPEPSPTLYARWGDVLPVIALILILIKAIFSWQRRRTR